MRATIYFRLSLRLALVILVDGNFGAPVNGNRTPFDPEQLRPLPRDHPDRKKLDGIIIDNV